MKRASIIAISIVLLSAAPVLAHRIDEYLQATTVLVSQGRLHLEMRLVPGIEIARKVLDGIDRDRDGVLSAAEQRAYTLSVVGDLSLTLDGKRVVLSLTSSRFDNMAALRDGTGEIQLILDAVAPAGGEVRRLFLENRHRPDISAYLVNSLVPDDPAIRIAKQQRSYSQSSYELDYVQRAAGAESNAGVSLFWALALIGLILAVGDELRRRLVRTRA